MDGIDPDRLADALRVLAEVEQLPTEHPDAVAVRRASAGSSRPSRSAAAPSGARRSSPTTRAVTAATATGAPGRIDDETAGLPLRSSATGATRGHARCAPRACYVCKQRYVEVDAFYHQLCPACAARNHARRDARTDLHRAPRAAHRRAGEDRHVHRAAAAARRRAHDDHDALPARRRPALRRDGRQRRLAATGCAIVGIDLRDPGQVVALADEVAAAGPARHPHQQRRADRAPLARGLRAPGRGRGGAAAGGPAARGRDARAAGARGAAAGARRTAHWSPTPHALTALALTAGSASPERIAAGTAIDAGGLVPDLARRTTAGARSSTRSTRSSCSRSSSATRPRRSSSSAGCAPALAASPARRTYVVNVSAMEGQFSRGYKGPGHPHTNMAKAALNMLTRTSAQELLRRRHPHDERRHRLDHRRAPAPDEDAARRARASTRRSTSSTAPRASTTRSSAARPARTSTACFLKDYAPAPW